MRKGMGSVCLCSLMYVCALSGAVFVHSPYVLCLSLYTLSTYSLSLSVHSLYVLSKGLCMYTLSKGALCECILPDE
jgi:hypothetical protein